jgi:hypothetical protein
MLPVRINHGKNQEFSRQFSPDATLHLRKHSNLQLVLPEFYFLIRVGICTEQKPKKKRFYLLMICVPSGGGFQKHYY